MADLIFIRVHAMPCVNRCWHCFCHGSPENGLVEGSTVLRLLDHLVELKNATRTPVFPMFYDEPTVHPDFVKIIGYQLDLGLIFDSWWFSTNGYGLARLSDAEWEELAGKGFNWIRLTFYGIGENHDRLAGRMGAYRDLVETIQRAERFGIHWLAGMMLTVENATEYERTKSAVERLGTPCTEFGWMLPQSSGRAEDVGNRVRLEHISHLITEGSGWKTEGEHVADILSSESMRAKQVLDPGCGILYLDIDRDLNVSFGGGCDGSLHIGNRSDMHLGNLEDEGLPACLDRYLNDPPNSIRRLSGVTWGDLARTYGDPDGPYIHHVTDMVGVKWASRYLQGIADK